MGHTNVPQQVFMPPFSPPFSAVNASHQIPHVTNDLGVFLANTFTVPVRCKEAANTARQLLDKIARQYYDRYAATP